jgi:CheY-like chemotaxis protein
VSRPPRVVFLIESDEAARVTHETILRTEGYEILSAAEGAPALQQVREQAPDLIIVGSKIGTVSTVQLIRMVKTDPSLSNVMIAVYAAPDAPNLLREEAFNAGADAFMKFPQTPHELIREVVTLIGRA